MHKLILVAGFFSELIEDWNDKLNSFASEYMDNAAFGGIIVLVLFVFGCWGISTLTKK